LLPSVVGNLPQRTRSSRRLILRVLCALRG